MNINKEIEIIKKYQPTDKLLELLLNNIEDVCESDIPYEMAVGNLSNDNSNFMFACSEGAHSAIVMANIIKSAKKEICINDDKLINSCLSFYKELPKSIVNAVKSNITIKIVTNNWLSSPLHDILESLNSANPSKVIVKLSTNEFKNHINGRSPNSIKFIFSGSKSLLNISSATATQSFACFNDAETVKEYKKSFDDGFYLLDSAFENKI